MPLTYYSLGSLKCLNQIVMAGSHDAGITGGRHNVQTQDLDIVDQAICGVRVFDIRIKAVGKHHPTLKTYHGKTKDPAKKSVKGAWGEGLTKILTDARNFVTSATYRKEFLILKFDKCTNWPDIASQCVHLLGDTIYKGTGNLNTKTLKQLKGKVIVLFTREGYQLVQNQYPPGSGILGVRTIKDAPYDPNTYHGMQYCGKGGTDVMQGGDVATKVNENYANQRERFQKGFGVGGHQDVMGMVYWTTTGIFESIRDRNVAMWDKHLPHRSRLKQMFKECLAESVQHRIGKDVDPTQHAFGTKLKVYMPNIVMIDFADIDNCNKIYKLNTTAATEITQAFQDLDQEIQMLQSLNLGGGRQRIRG